MKTRRIRLMVVLTLALLLSAAPLAVAAPGDLDPSFDGDGKVITAVSAVTDRGLAVTVDSAGRYVVAGLGDFGYGPDFALARYLTDGSLDTSFGGDGIVTTSFGAYYYSIAQAVACDAADRIVAGGVSNGDFALIRYNPDGSTDPTFGADGKVMTDFAGSFDEGVSLALDTAGRIVLAGYSWSGGFAVVRYNPDGSLDTTFDSDGKVMTDFGVGARGYSVAIDSAGRIVVAGESADNFAVARYNSDGSLDTSFDADGMVTTDFEGSTDVGRDVVLDSTGRIVVVGGAYAPDFSVAIARYNSNGSLDTTFDNDGKAIVDFGEDDTGYAAVIDAAGRIVVAGQSGMRFIVGRILADGTPDVSFGSEGKVITDSELRGARGVALDDSDRIVAVGFANVNDYHDFAVARYLGGSTEPSPSTTIDIKPGEPDNVIDLSERGKIAVAILSSDQFNAPEQVVRPSLTFGRTGDEKSLLFRKGNVPNCSTQDVNGDQRVDLVCWFLVKLADFRLDVTEGILRGSTLFESPIEGRDMVQVVP